MTKDTWQQRIRREYEMPAKEVIETYARDKYSRWFTAQRLGISVNTLKAYCFRKGIEFSERPDLREECKPKAWNNENNPTGRNNARRMVETGANHANA